MGLDLLAGDGEVGREHPVDVFGVGSLGHGGEADQVAEEGRDDLAFLRGQRSHDQCTAGVAEPRPGWVVRIAGWTRNHATEDRRTGSDVERPTAGAAALQD